MAAAHVRSGDFDNSIASTGTIIAVVKESTAVAVVTVAFNSTVPSVSAVIDSGGNTYALLSKVTTNNTVEVWGSTGGAASTNVTVSHGSNRCHGAVEIVSGCDAFGSQSTASGNDTAPTVTVSFTGGSLIVMGFASDDSALPTASAGILREAQNYGGGTKFSGGLITNSTAGTCAAVIGSATWGVAAVECLMPSGGGGAVLYGQPSFCLTGIQ